MSRVVYKKAVSVSISILKLDISAGRICFAVSLANLRGFAVFDDQYWAAQCFVHLPHVCR
jgi:hypothetical protein